MVQTSNQVYSEPDVLFKEPNGAQIVRDINGEYETFTYLLTFYAVKTTGANEDEFVYSQQTTLSFVRNGDQVVANMDGFEFTSDGADFSGTVPKLYTSIVIDEALIPERDSNLIVSLIEDLGGADTPGVGILAIESNDGRGQLVLYGDFVIGTLRVKPCAFSYVLN